MARVKADGAEAKVESAKEEEAVDGGREATGTEDREAKDKEAHRAKAGDPAADATSGASPVVVAENPRARVVNGVMEDPVRKAIGTEIEPF